MLGRKRLVAVDSLGLIRALLVTPAAAQDRDAGYWLLDAARGPRPAARGRGCVRWSPAPGSAAGSSIRCGGGAGGG